MCLWDTVSMWLDVPTDALFWRNVSKTYFKCSWQALGAETEMVKRNSHFHASHNFWMVEEQKQMMEIVLKKRHISWFHPKYTLGMGGDWKSWDRKTQCSGCTVQVKWEDVQKWRFLWQYKFDYAKTKQSLDSSDLTKPSGTGSEKFVCLFCPKNSY